jgi:hypothetical protein
MNYARVLITSIAATVVLFVYGGIVFTSAPVRNEFQRYAALYRPIAAMKPLIPIALLTIFIAIVIVVVLFAMTSQRGALAGARFGALVGLFAVCAFVFHNYVNLNLGLRLTVIQAIAYFIEWTLVGLVIGLLYKPTTTK